MKTLLLLLSVLFISCVAYVARGGDDTPTLLVRNDGLEVIKVYDPYSKLGEVLPSQSRCLKLGEYSGQFHLYLRTVGEEEVTPYVSPQIRHWQIRIGTEPLRYGAISLVPAGGSCASP